MKEPETDNRTTSSYRSDNFIRELTVLHTMTSLFYANQCDVDKDIFVSQVVWSNVEPLAALACYTADDRGHEIGQILFVNNEVGGN